MVVTGTQETLRQVYMTMTKKQTAPFKLWIESPTEMRIFSNKRESLITLFKWLDFKGFKRINAAELFAVFIIAIQGNEEFIIQSKYYPL